MLLRRTHDISRLEAFSDAVFAFALLDCRGRAEELRLFFANGIHVHVAGALGLWEPKGKKAESVCGPVPTRTSGRIRSVVTIL